MSGDKALVNQVRGKILEVIRQGNFRNHAAQSVGISDQTIRSWMRWGEKDGAKEPYKSFAREGIEAEGEAIAACAGSIHTAALTDWKAAAWFLARKAPNEWGDKARKGVKEQLESILSAVEDVLGKENAAKVYDEIARRASSETPGQTKTEDAVRH